MGESFRSKALDWAAAAAQREAQEIYGDASALYDLPEPHPMTRTPTETMLLEALEGLEPYLDAIVCYASTMGEHEPNRLAHNARRAIATAKGEDRT